MHTAGGIMFYKYHFTVSILFQCDVNVFNVLHGIIYKMEKHKLSNKFDILQYLDNLGAPGNNVCSVPAC